jgi:CRISPR-associated endonuclease/helicase Cas3
MKLWGKAGKDEDGNLIWHPLVYHMLDVAAVAEAWLNEDEQLKKLFSNLSGLQEKEITVLLPLACALHDVGKATIYFQNKIPEITKQNHLFHEIASNTSGFNHGSFGCHWIDDWREEEVKFQEWAKDFSFLQEETFLELWKAASWHHGVAFISSDYSNEYGKYPKEGDNKPKAKNDIFDTIVSFRNETLQHVAKKVLSEYDGSISNLKRINPSFIRIFAGFVSVCDWIGSDKEFFEYNQNDNTDYYKIAKQNANRALNKIKLIPEPIERITTFDKILDKERVPRPVQKALEELRIDKPSLLIVEAPTGEGKTESALFQFVRNPGRGFYFGLPTQASANQISGRIKIFLKDKLKTKEEAILAHGNSWLVKAISESKGYGEKNKPEEHTAESELSDWFNSKKRTLLSRFGIGTVDQAMLSALNVKHGFVKLFGLAGKTLIIDEVHAYDSFMLPIIEHLLRWCSYLETSVVLLSATLPFSMKQRLVSVYLEKDNIQLKNENYPLLTIATKADNMLLEIDSYKNEKIRTRKTESIKYSFICHEKDFIGEVIKKALSIIEKGGNLLWICNTVKKAQFVYEELKKKLEEEHIDDLEILLFHSRFTKMDRLTIEDHIEKLYGDESKAPHRPKKSIVVATQVAEQSLDVDFDYLITDIAPIDLILQRAGRVFRHERKNRNLTFSSSEVILLIPNVINTLKDFAGVYDKFTVLKTMFELAKNEVLKIQLPVMYRSLVDAVYSDVVPESELIETKSHSIKISKFEWDQLLKKKLSKKEELDFRGRKGLIPLPTTEDYMDSALLDEDENSYWQAKTRDGEESVSLILVYENNGIYTVGGLHLSETIPEKIPVNLAIAFAQNTVDVGTKDFIGKVKKEKSLVSTHSILDDWQKKIDKVSQFKGNKFILMQKNEKTNLILSCDEYILGYDSVIGFKVQRNR